MAILIADDHPFSLQGTKAFVESLGYTVSDICSNGITALNMIKVHQPQIAILDINMPGMDGLEVLEKVFTERLNTKVVLLTMHREMTIYKKASACNVYGYLLKNFAAAELETCLEEVCKNRKYISSHITQELVNNHTGIDDDIVKLSFTEKKIFELIIQHKTSRQISDLLFIAEKTIEGHRRNMIEKLGLPKEKNALLHFAAQYLERKGR